MIGKVKLFGEVNDEVESDGGELEFELFGGQCQNVVECDDENWGHDFCYSVLLIDIYIILENPEGVKGFFKQLVNSPKDPSFEEGQVPVSGVLRIDQTMEIGQE